MRARNVALFFIGTTLAWCVPNGAFAATDVTSDITADTRWTLDGSPYVIDGNPFQNPITVASNTTLVIDAGVVVKFAEFNGLTVNGTLRALGTASEPIIFTALADDTVGGDINEDGADTMPTDEQWRHLQFNTGSVGIFDHTIVRYGGGNNLIVANTGIDNSGGTVTIDHTTLTHNGFDGLGQHSGHTTLTNSFISNQTVGISMSGGVLDMSDTRIYDNVTSGIDHSDGTLSVTHSEIDHNGTGIVVSYQGSITISNSSIHDNSLGVDNETQIIDYDEFDNPYVSDPGISIDARNNWWGIASGPQGDEVYGDVAYTPWLTSDPFAPPDPCATPGACASNVLFLPGIEGSRLYRPDYAGGTDQLWEPNIDSDVQDLYMNSDGTSVRFDVYTKEGDVIDELPSGGNIYKSFIAKMNDLEMNGTITDWEPIAYDWRLSLDDILNYGNDVQGRIYYSGDLRATSTPYIIQELKRLAAASKTGKVTIVAHSNGGLLAKRLTELLGPAESARLIDKMIFVAVPQAGTPAAVPAGLHGYEQDHILGLITSESTARTFAQNSPMEYQLLPSAQYFTYVDDPVITFDASLTDWISRYGATIHSEETLHAFLIDSYGRVNAQTGDINQPIQFNSSLLSNAETLHTDPDTGLDNWAPPAGVELVQIAGWGVPKTVEGITYKKKGTGVTPEANFTVDGDGTVVVPSALWTSTTTGATNYWVDLNDYNRDHPFQSGLGFSPLNHSRILETTQLLDFLSDQIINTTKPLSDYVYLSTEAPSSNDVRLRYALHSPLTLNLYDDQGRHTGVSTSTGQVEEQIPGTYYTEFGDVKYLFSDADIPAHILMDGYASGTFTFNIDQYTGDTVTASTTFKDIPTTASTAVSLDIQSDISTLSPMQIDKNSDGKNIITLTPKLGETVNYEPPAPAPEPAPEPTVSSAGSRGGGGGRVVTPVTAPASVGISMDTPAVITQPVPMSASEAATAKPVQVKNPSTQLGVKKAPIAVAPPKKVNTNIPPQTASVYDASQQSVLTWLGNAVYNSLHGFWVAFKSLF